MITRFSLAYPGERLVLGKSNTHRASDNLGTQGDDRIEEQTLVESEQRIVGYMHICHTVVFFEDSCALHRIGMGQPKPLPGFLQPQRLDLMVPFQKQHILATRMFQPLISGKRCALAGNLEDYNPLITQRFDDLPDIMSATRIDNQYLKVRARYLAPDYYFAYKVEKPYLAPAKLLANRGIP